MEYTELDLGTRLAQVKGRIRELETQYLSISLRVQAPDANSPMGAGANDQANLTKLEASLQVLHNMEASLQSVPAV